MPKRHLQWLSIPAIFSLLAFIYGMRPEDAIKDIEGKIVEKVGETVGNVLNKNGSATIPTGQTAGYSPNANGYPTNAPNSGGPFTLPNPWNSASATNNTPYTGVSYGNPVQQPAINPSATTRVPYDNRALIIGTFNIQVFGRAKLGNPDVMEIIVDLARRFDVLAIQELRSTEQDIIPKFLTMLNATGMNYQALVGERQGYTTSQEQYVYLYDANKLRVLEKPYLADDRGQMHRTPFVAYFQVTQIPSVQAFTFCLMNVHTDPDNVQTRSNPNELSVLKDVVARVIQQHPNEDDFIVLGDFNAPTDHIKRFEWMPYSQYVVKDEWVTNVRENQNYDNIVFNSRRTTEFNNTAGVFNFKKSYSLSLDQALQVSDHFPVWGMFSIFESSASDLAQQPGIPR